MPAPFPSVDWFQGLAEAMAAAPERYRKLGPLDITLVPRVRFPDGREELYVLRFEGLRCTSVAHAQTLDAVPTRHAVLLDGAIEAWREMIDNIRTHGAADLTHTLNYLTLPDWPLRIEPLDPDAGQLDADRFYRYIETLQAFFDDAAKLETGIAA